MNPIAISGPWTDGRVIDVHSTSGDFVGHDESGHEVFATHRTEVGEPLYRLKDQRDTGVLAELDAIAENCIRSWGIEFDIIVPAPPSRVRDMQPGLRACP